MQRFDVAVVGGGASGTFFVSEALRKSTGWTLLWVAPPDSPGVAYSSTLESHLLNVPAERMGAFVDGPGDFHEWLKSSADFPAYGPLTSCPVAFSGTTCAIWQRPRLCAKKCLH